MYNTEINPQIYRDSDPFSFCQLPAQVFSSVIKASSDTNGCGWLLLTACELKQHFVIEAQSKFRHPWQDHFELDATHYFTAQDTATGTHLQRRKYILTLVCLDSVNTYATQSNLPLAAVEVQSDDYNYNFLETNTYSLFEELHFSDM